jgi:methylated-DNA-protein-cysteine methyltransferase-like protein
VNLREELFERVRAIPRGRVANYGALGQALSRPVSGVVVGGWLLTVPEGVPWWRVVGRDGRLPIWKRDPSMESLQAARLEEEGVGIVDGVVGQEFFVQDL